MLQPLGEERESWKWPSILRQDHTDHTKQQPQETKPGNSPSKCNVCSWRDSMKKMKKHQVTKNFIEHISDKGLVSMVWEEGLKLLSKRGKSNFFKWANYVGTSHKQTNERLIRTWKVLNIISDSGNFKIKPRWDMPQSQHNSWNQRLTTTNTSKIGAAPQFSLCWWENKTFHPLGEKKMLGSF